MRSLVKRNFVYYFRLRIPSDVRKHFPSAEIVRSMHTKLYRQAKSLACGLLGQLERDFMTIRAGVLTDDEIEKLVSKYKRESLEKHNEFQEILLTTDGGNLEKVRTDLREHYGTSVDAAKEALLNQRGMQEQVVYTASKLLGMPWKDMEDGVNISSYGADFKRLCHAVSRTEKEIFETLIQRNETGDSEYDRLERLNPKSKTFSELLAMYHKEKAGAWKDAASTKAIHNRILHIVGDIRLDEIDRQMCVQFRDSLKDYPLKNNDYQTPWRELAKRKKGRLSDRTQHSTLSEFVSLLKYANKHGLGVRGLPADGLLGDKAACKRLKIRDPFTVDELNRMVLSLVQRERELEPENFWIPMLLLYTGARANEICMLRCADLAQTEKGWCIFFRNRLEYHQRTKNGEDKIVPIHRHLIQLGLIEYLEQQKQTGHDRLFKNLKLYNGKWNKGFGKTFNRTLKMRFLGGYSKEELAGKDLHTFRVTFISWFVKSGLVKNLESMETLKSIIGHFENYEMQFIMKYLQESALTIEGYGGGFSVDQFAFMEQLDYGVDLSPLFKHGYGTLEL